MNMYSIWDVKAGVYHRPCFLENDIVAKRMFRATLRIKEESLLREFPDDFALCRLGEWDEKTGKLMRNEPENLGFARDFIDEDVEEQEEPG